MPYKVGKLYCVIAQEPCVVKSVTDKNITVENAAGKLTSYSLGPTYGRMEGSVYKHEIVTDRKVGDKIKEQDYITYNSGFFEKDWLDSSKLIMKFSRSVTTAFMMNDEVYEDSSAISQSLSEKMSTPYVPEKVFLIEMSKNIIGLRDEGSPIEPNDVLFTVIDGGTDYTNLSDSSIELLKTVSSLSPKAKLRGKIFKYEVKYNGEYSDMSPSIKKFISSIDKDMVERTKNSGEEVKDNSVSGEYRSEGRNLLPGMMELRVFIESTVSQGIGDKGVFGSQMKSVVSSVFQSDITTESGTPIEAQFSFRSVLNRTVLSPILLGMTSRILKHVSPKIAEAYFT